jgi:hypothetical protein
MKYKPFQLKPQMFYFWIKVTTHYHSGERLHFVRWSGYTWEQFTRWKWYFEYRAALFKVKNPRAYVEVKYGPEPATGKTEFTILRNRIRAKKAKITEFTNKLKMAEDSWNELFPIVEDQLYKRAVTKIERLKNELTEMEAEYSLKSK